jgi:hypothetical protein
LTPEAVIAALHTHAAELWQSGIHNAGLSGSRAARRIRTPTSTVWRSWTRGGGASGGFAWLGWNGV